MRSYATEAREMQVYVVKATTSADLCKQDRAQIQATRDRLARELRLDRLRFEMDVNRWLR